MRKLTTLATAMAMLALALPMQASARNRHQAETKTEAPKTAAATTPKAKVVTVKKNKHYAKRHRHHRVAMHKKHRRHMAAHKTPQDAQAYAASEEASQACRAEVVGICPRLAGAAPHRGRSTIRPLQRFHLTLSPAAQHLEVSI